MGLDSLDAVMLITAIEEEFHMVMQDNVFSHISCLNDVVKRVLETTTAY